MAEIVVCDLCDDKEALKPQFGMYQITVKHFTKVTSSGGKTYAETEFDLCGACMEKLRKAGLKD